MANNIINIHTLFPVISTEKCLEQSACIFTLNIFIQNVNILIQNGATDRRLAPYLIKQKQPLNLAGFSNGGCFCLCSYVLRLHACGLIARSSPQSFQLQLRFQKLQEQILLMLCTPSFLNYTINNTLISRFFSLNSIFFT